MTMLERTPAPQSTNGTEVAQGLIQFVSREKTSEEARVNSETFFDLLVNKAGIVLPSWNIQSITGDRPNYLGQNESNWFEYSANHLISYKHK